MAKTRRSIKAGARTGPEEPRVSEQPDFYKTNFPVWRFGSFDWDGPWGLSACASKNWRSHIEQHLASFETMTWAEIERASGGKRAGRGANSHPLSRDRFSRNAINRLKEKNIFGDSFFSLRLENTVRIYGIREGSCLRIIWFDPFHFQGDGRAAYRW